MTNTNTRYFTREQAPVCFHAINQPLVEAMHAQGFAQRNALGVLIKDPKIREWLKANDPKALEQAETAFGEEGK